MQTNIRQELSEALSHTSKEYAPLVMDSMTRIEEYPAPFFQLHHIYRLEHLSPRKPILFYVGFASGGAAYLLTDHPENYMHVARADGLVIASTEVATSYAIGFLEVTRSMSRTFYVVHSTEDVRFRPNLANEETRNKEAFIQKYSSTIAPATAQVEDDRYHVDVFVVRGQALEKDSLTIEKNGAIQLHPTTLEQNLPLVYGL